MDSPVTVLLKNLNFLFPDSGCQYNPVLYLICGSPEEDFAAFINNICSDEYSPTAGHVILEPL